MKKFFKGAGLSKASVLEAKEAIEGKRKLNTLDRLKEKELSEISVVKEYLTTAADGKTSKCWKTWRRA